MSACSSDFVLDAAFGDALPPSAQRELERHLLECPRCARRRQLLASQREEFFGKHPERPSRRPRSRYAERLSRQPPTGWRPSFRAAVMLALGVLWLLLWLRAATRGA